MPAEDREVAARRAADALFGSMSDNGSTRSATSWHAGTDVGHGGESCCGCRPKISPIRRTFCLFVVFDVILAFILWVIYKKVTQPYEISLTKDDLDFRKELFDTVLLAYGRFIVLIASYAALMSRKPWAVAVTTFATCAMLVVKAVLFCWDLKPSKAIDVCILVVSLVVSWGETWLLDFKVLPWEEKHRQRALANLNGIGHGSDYDENGPLLPSRLPRITYGADGGEFRPQSSREGYHTPLPDDDEYLSPITSRTSPRGSPPQDDFHSLIGSRRTSRVPSLIGRDLELQKYTRSGEEALATAWQLMAEPVSPDDANAALPVGWKLESSAVLGDISAGQVFSKRVPNKGKIFRMSAVIDAPARTVFSIIVDECEKTPEWNPTLLEVRILLPVDESTKVAYNVAAAAVGGAVSSRDFVYVMHNVLKEGWYVSAYVSTDYAAMPPQKNFVRGEQRPGLTRVRTLGPDRCHIESMLDTQLNGWLPQYLIDQAMASVMLDYLKHLKQRCCTAAKGSSATA